MLSKYVRRRMAFRLEEVDEIRYLKYGRRHSFTPPHRDCDPGAARGDVSHWGQWTYAEYAH
jgi:hypothetical protein